MGIGDPSVNDIVENGPATTEIPPDFLALDTAATAAATPTLTLQISPTLRSMDLTLLLRRRHTPIS